MAPAGHLLLLAILLCASPAATRASLNYPQLQHNYDWIHSLTFASRMDSSPFERQIVNTAWELYVRRYPNSLLQLSPHINAALSMPSAQAYLEVASNPSQTALFFCYKVALNLWRITNGQPLRLVIFFAVPFDRPLNVIPNSFQAFNN
ncbi:hypothetical protein AXF42_Ash021808 [Apostasia shenzhenica]|uniref:Uncharacterized protein n=1 Tax=Apostasia shenzhenica TaxID=1088818 RepID=A0A2H9ZVT7_9ASPA|nr:hypothetical protein AXF42_Ash021808 [Apostasia shenzhenica]